MSKERTRKREPRRISELDDSLGIYAVVGGHKHERLISNNRFRSAGIAEV
jgi:hypothetical protein